MSDESSRDANPYASPSTLDQQDKDDGESDEAYFRSFVGGNPYYLDRWQRVRAGRSAGFNIAAFFLSIDGWATARCIALR